MRRRALLLGSLAPVAFAAGANAAPAARKAASRRPSALPARRLQIRHAHTGARFSGPYHNGRTHDPIAMADPSLVLADSSSEEHTSELQSRQYVVCRLL